MSVECSGEMSTVHMKEEINIYIQENTTKLATFETNLLDPQKVYLKVMKTAEILDWLNQNHHLGYKDEYFTNKIKFEEAKLKKLQKLLAQLPLSSTVNDTYRVEIMNFQPIDKIMKEYESMLPISRLKRQSLDFINIQGKSFSTVPEALKKVNIIGCRKDLLKIEKKDGVCIVKLLKAIDKPVLENMGALRDMLIKAMSGRGSILSPVSLKAINVILEPNGISTRKVTKETLISLLKNSAQPYQNTDPTTVNPVRQLDSISSTLNGVSNSELKRVFGELTGTVKASLDKQERLLKKAEKEFKAYEATAILSVQNARSLSTLEELEKENDLDQTLLIGNQVLDQILEDVDRVVALVESNGESEAIILGHPVSISKDDKNRITVTFHPINLLEGITGNIEPTQICGSSKCIKFTMDDEFIGTMELTKIYRRKNCTRLANKGVLCASRPIETPPCFFPTKKHNCSISMMHTLQPKAVKLNQYQAIVGNLTKEIKLGRVTLEPEKVYTITVKEDTVLEKFGIALKGRKDQRYPFQADEFRFRTTEIDQMVTGNLIKSWLEYFFRHSLINSLALSVLAMALLIMVICLCCKKESRNKRLPERKLERKNEKNKKKRRIERIASEEDIIPLRIRTKP